MLELSAVSEYEVSADGGVARNSIVFRANGLGHNQSYHPSAEPLRHREPLSICLHCGVLIKRHASNRALIGVEKEAGKMEHEDAMRIDDAMRYKQESRGAR